MPARPSGKANFSEEFGNGEGKVTGEVLAGSHSICTQFRILILTLAGGIW
jgi:hypothetical protein